MPVLNWSGKEGHLSVLPSFLPSFIHSIIWFYMGSDQRSHSAHRYLLDQLTAVHLCGTFRLRIRTRTHVRTELEPTRAASVRGGNQRMRKKFIVHTTQKITSGVLFLFLCLVSVRPLPKPHLSLQPNLFQGNCSWDSVTLFLRFTYLYAYPIPLFLFGHQYIHHNHPASPAWYFWAFSWYPRDGREIAT
ncbi:hypothetical protein EDB82DRAFT_74865 [Fusarium venenatum]|uniref:uncharacterized protein n=1 Tax=Fusarium venenatum TaxID=56646 RepID=UPI001DDDE787|nr:hypothetical protein EDB82DRAFT_74865 [Fusarium venenatum]